MMSHTGVVGGLIVSGTGMIDVVTAKLFQLLKKPLKSTRIRTTTYT